MFYVDIWHMKQHIQSSPHSLNDLCQPSGYSSPEYDAAYQRTMLLTSNYYFKPRPNCSFLRDSLHILSNSLPLSCNPHHSIITALSSFSLLVMLKPNFSELFSIHIREHSFHSLIGRSFSQQSLRKSLGLSHRCPLLSATWWLVQVNFGSLSADSLSSP